MITLRLTRGDSYETVSLQLPATPGEVGEAFAQLDEISRHAGETKIVEASSPVRNLGKYLRGMDLSGDGLDKLGRLAERIDNMSRREHQIFSGALDAESVNGLDDVLRIADSLADYEIIPEVSSDRELGNYVVDRGLIMDFPEAVRPYLLEERGQGAPRFMERFAAALEYEGCRDLRLALDIAQNLRCYEWIPSDSLRDLGLQKLRESGVAEELLASGVIDLESCAAELLEIAGYLLTTDESGYITRNSREFIHDRTAPERAEPVMGPL